MKRILVHLFLLLAVTGTSTTFHASAQGYFFDPSDRPPLPFNANEIAEISRFGGASPSNIILVASINDGGFYLFVGQLTEPVDVLYSTPDTDNPIQLNEVLAAGFAVVIIGISEDGEWIPRTAIELVGLEGELVEVYYVEDENTLSNGLVASTLDAEAFELLLAQLIEPLNAIYAEPKEGSRIALGESLPPGFTVAINAVSEDGLWIRFIIGTETYWIPSHAVDLDGEQGTLTLAGFLQMLGGG